MWNKEKIDKHKEAARFLEKIKNEVFDLISREKNIDEYRLKEFILSRYRRYNLKTDNDPIVAFGKNTSHVHYHPSQHCLTIKKGDLIMIDIWARLKEKSSPYADITWMAYFGENIDPKIEKIFNLVISSRDKVIKFIKNNLSDKKIPTGHQIDKIARDFISNSGYEKDFKHTLGHSLGIHGPHGKYNGLKSKNNKKLLKNIAYTVEPGIYLENKFGIRSEMDFYINDNFKFLPTTLIQKELKIIK
jgi:Xaa-Pro aminopeptidase